VELARAWGSRARARERMNGWVRRPITKVAVRVIPDGAMGVQSSAVARREVVRVLWFTAERSCKVTEWAIEGKCYWGAEES